MYVFLLPEHYVFRHGRVDEGMGVHIPLELCGIHT